MRILGPRFTIVYMLIGNIKYVRHSMSVEVDVDFHCLVITNADSCHDQMT